MNTKLTNAFIAICLLLAIKSYSQVTSPGNVAGGGTEYIGWDGTGGNTKHLDLQNKFANKNINFSTNSTGTNGSPNWSSSEGGHLSKATRI